MFPTWHSFGLLTVLAVACNTAQSGGLSMDKYHSHDEMTAFLKNITKIYPQLTSLYNIGDTVSGRELWVMEVTGKNSSEKMKPNVKLVANIHGNEVVGRELLLYFIEYLVTSYNTSDKRVTQLLDYARVHILPSINPDGFEIALSQSKPDDFNKCYTGPGRNNKRGLNLNRNFPDYFRKNTKPVQAETVAIKEWMDKTPFVLSASLHGGSLVAIYPFDNTPEDTVEEPDSSLTPDDDVFKYLATVYSKTHPTMYKGESCPNMNMKFKGGISNGAAWYTFTGGMQDYNYMKGCMEITLEISCCKFPKASDLPQLWNENKEAMLLYLMQVMRGVHGKVTDKDGKPIRGALLRIAGRSVSFYSTEAGQFWRILLPGDYLLQVAANGYENKSLPFTVAGSPDFTDTRSVLLDVKLNRISASTPVSKKQNVTQSPATEQPTTLTIKTTNSVTEPSPNEVRQHVSNSSEWKLGESKSGVISKCLNNGVGLFALLMVFLF